MITAYDEIKEQQRQTWNKFSSGWGKWDELTMGFLRPAGDEIIRLANLKEHYRVLDVATGTGEPGLTAATIVKKGTVIGTDLSEDMIKIARKAAQRKGLKNYDTRECDAGRLPFGDNEFDAVICRFGFMFFPDMEVALKEMVRVLKPGGRLVTSVWSTPDKNAWASTIMSIISSNIPAPPPPPGAPGLFRCAQPQMMSGLFQKAGLINVTEKPVAHNWRFESVEQYWSLMTEVAAPVVAALSNAA
ncbi:MAG TPA: methyltransferase domain-containing protein, partial [Chitinophagales bacterium]|nr:methyltransferase domain-containing protein [Chitinophagales bacterium]